MINGQIDSESKLVPSLHDIMQTYRGNTTNTCLENYDWIFETFYEKSYVNGMVNEEEYDNNNIPLDRNFNGDAVLRDMNISLENRQRAKVLSSLVQIESRNAVTKEKKQLHYQKQLALYEN